MKHLGWKLTSLEDIVEPSSPIRYGVVQIGEDSDDGVPIVPIKFITSINSSKLHRASKRIEGKYANSRVRAGDVLISVKGTIGAVGIVPEGFKGNIAREIARIRPADGYDSTYIALQLQSDKTQREIKNLTVGTTRREFSIHALRKFSIPVPPLLEQKKIAKILSTWDKAITTAEQLLTNTQQQKKALMQQLLTGKKRLLNKNGVRFSGEWKHRYLKQLLDISKGVQLNKDTLSKAGAFPVINGGVEPSGYTSDFNTQANTITISEGGNSCGHVGFQTKNFWCGGHCYAIKNLKINPAFAYHLLKFNQIRIMRLRVGSGLPNIQKRDLESLNVNVPSDSEEQQEIASILSAADKKIEILQEKLNALRKEKKALMQQLLTGKRRVSVCNGGDY